MQEAGFEKWLATEFQISLFFRLPLISPLKM